MVATLYIDFKDTQGQLTPESVMGTGQNSNSSKLVDYTYKNEEHCGSIWLKVC